MVVKDHLSAPVRNVRVALVQRKLLRGGQQQEEMPCPDGSTSGSNGLAVFICNVPKEATRAELTVRGRGLHKPRPRAHLTTPSLPPPV